MLPSIALAAMTIDQIPIAVVQFRDESGLKQQITSVIAADLTRSGLFKMVDATGVKPQHEPEQVDYPQWRARDANAVVIGSVIPQSDGRYEVRFRLMDAVRQTQLAGFSYSA
ncbi:MAG: Tol-Pal system protein TolB, partial [Burkholderiales bacterium]